MTLILYQAYSNFAPGSGSIDDMIEALPASLVKRVLLLRSQLLLGNSSGICSHALSCLFYVRFTVGDGVFKVRICLIFEVTDSFQVIVNDDFCDHFAKTHAAALLVPQKFLATGENGRLSGIGALHGLVFI